MPEDAPSRVRLDWLLYEKAWELFKDHVLDEYGILEGYLGHEVERAMREHLDRDAYADVEDGIDRLVKAAGRTPDGCVKEKNYQTEGDLTRVSVWIHEDVKESFAILADKHDKTYGRELARALERYRHGGRADRIEAKLDRVVDDAEALLSETDDSSDDDGLGAVERRTVTICHRLPDEFTDEELRMEIADVAGDSEPTVEKYRERVTDRLEAEPHPIAKADLWVPSEVAADIAPDEQPRVCRLPVWMLDEAERQRRLKLAIGRLGAKRANGQARATADEIRTDVFNDEIRTPAVLELMEAVALDDGWELTRKGEVATLGTDLEAVQEADPELMHDLLEYREMDNPQLLAGSTGTTMTEWTSSPDSPASPPSVDDQLDVLDSAQTDGGGPSRGGDGGD